MVEQEIIEGNKLIAEFMNVESFNDGRYGLLYISPINGKTEFELKYHSSWDWLMSVVEKIENDLHDSFNVDIVNKNQCEIFRNGNEFIGGYGFETVYHSKIKAVYYSVVEFIKWYKSCQKEK